MTTSYDVTCMSPFRFGRHEWDSVVVHPTCSGNDLVDDIWRIIIHFISRCRIFGLLSLATRHTRVVACKLVTSFRIKSFTSTTFTRTPANLTVCLRTFTNIEKLVVWPAGIGSLTVVQAVVALPHLVQLTCAEDFLMCENFYTQPTTLRLHTLFILMSETNRDTPRRLAPLLHFPDLKRLKLWSDDPPVAFYTDILNHCPTIERLHVPGIETVGLLLLTGGSYPTLRTIVIYHQFDDYHLHRLLPSIPEHIHIEIRYLTLKSLDWSLQSFTLLAQKCSIFHLEIYKRAVKSSWTIIENIVKSTRAKTLSLHGFSRDILDDITNNPTVTELPDLTRLQTDISLPPHVVIPNLATLYNRDRMFRENARHYPCNFSPLHLRKYSDSTRMKGLNISEHFLRMPYLRKLHLIDESHLESIVRSQTLPLLTSLKFRCLTIDGSRLYRTAMLVLLSFERLERFDSEFDLCQEPESRAIMLESQAKEIIRANAHHPVLRGLHPEGQLELYNRQHRPHVFSNCRYKPVLTAIYNFTPPNHLFRTMDWTLENTPCHQTYLEMQKQYLPILLAATGTDVNK